MVDVDYFQRIEIKDKLRKILAEDGNENIGPEEIITILEDLKRQAK